jgi:hypothetical protein
MKGAITDVRQMSHQAADTPFEVVIFESTNKMPKTRKENESSILT